MKTVDGCAVCANCAITIVEDDDTFKWVKFECNAMAEHNIAVVGAANEYCGRFKRRK